MYVREREKRERERELEGRAVKRERSERARV